MSLHTTTISRFLHQTLMELMRSPQLQSFHLADASALSLQFGHRISNEIDLYTTQSFQENDWQRIKQYIHNTFGNGELHQFKPKGEGVSFFLYNLNRDAIKIDLYASSATDSVVELIENLRFASLEDLMALTIEHIRKGGSKSNFWDLHYLLSVHSLEALLAAHKARFPDQHKKSEIMKRLVDFKRADDDLDPKCLLGKKWSLVKLDVIDFVS